MSLGTRFETALAVTARLHRRQRRKGGEIPYVAHLLAVTALVLEHGGCEDEAIAALLHDAVEDQGGEATAETIERLFGERVRALVDACTDAAMGSPAAQLPWRRRKEAHLERLAGADDAVILIVTADKLHNLRAIVSDYKGLGERLWSRFVGGREGTVWYYRRINEVVCHDAPPGLARQYREALDELVAIVGAVPPDDSDESDGPRSAQR